MTPDLVLADRFDNISPAFRPDGRHLLFLSNRGSAEFDLWELDLDTGNPNQLTFESEAVGSFAVSATNRIAYAPFWHDTFLFVVDVTTGERRQSDLAYQGQLRRSVLSGRQGRSLTTPPVPATPRCSCTTWMEAPRRRSRDSPRWDVSPNWSPDGRQLIFSSSRQDETFKLFVTNRDGGGERLLVDQPISVRDTYTPAAVARLVSRWSPDGKRIGYLVTAAGSNVVVEHRPRPVKGPARSSRTRQGSTAVSRQPARDLHAPKRGATTRSSPPTWTPERSGRSSRDR